MDASALSPSLLPSLRLDLFPGEDPSDGRKMLLARARLLPSESFAAASEAERFLALSRCDELFSDLWLLPQPRALSEHGGDPAAALLASLPVAPGEFAASFDAAICRHWAEQAREALSRATGPLGCLRSAEIFLSGAPAPSLEAAAESAALSLQILPCGSFRCDGALLAIDPCYGDSGEGISLAGARGEYRAWSVIRGQGEWGARRAELWICADGETPLSQFPGAAGWRLEPGSVGVDSGQAGFFSLESFSRAKSDPALEAPFYRGCCEASSRLGAGSLAFGSVSSSGDGDGGYDCLSLRGPDGDLLAARLEFYPRDPAFERDLLAAKASFESPLIGSAAAESPQRRIARRL